MKLKKTTSGTKAPKQSGFTLVEVMIAIAVMSIGLLSVVASIATAMQATQSAQEDLIARQKAMEALESIYTARNSQQVAFNAINNTSAGGIFLSGAQPLLCAGPDGLVGTGDDVPCTTSGGLACPNGGVECWVLPGPDGVLGTADDVTYSLANFTRTISFNQVYLSTTPPSVNQNMIAVSVSVSYSKDGLPKRTFTVNGLISSFN